MSIRVTAELCSDAELCSESRTAPAQVQARVNGGPAAKMAVVIVAASTVGETSASASASPSLPIMQRPTIETLGEDVTTPGWSARNEWEPYSPQELQVIDAIRKWLGDNEFDECPYDILTAFVRVRAHLLPQTHAAAGCTHTPLILCERRATRTGKTGRKRRLPTWIAACSGGSPTVRM